MVERDHTSRNLASRSQVLSLARTHLHGHGIGIIIYRVPVSAQYRFTDHKITSRESAIESPESVSNILCIYASAVRRRCALALRSALGIGCANANQLCGRLASPCAAARACGDNMLRPRSQLAREGVLCHVDLFYMAACFSMGKGSEKIQCVTHVIAWPARASQDL